jgi:hypothetical protein
LLSENSPIARLVCSSTLPASGDRNEDGEVSIPHILENTVIVTEAGSDSHVHSGQKDLPAGVAALLCLPSYNPFCGFFGNKHAARQEKEAGRPDTLAPEVGRSCTWL